MAHRALRVAGDDARVVASAALALAVLGRDPGSAVELADRATALNPGSSFAWLNSGIVRLINEEDALAVEHLETSMRLDPLGPNRGPLLLSLAMTHFYQRRFREAVGLLKEHRQLSDSPSGHAYRAAAHGHLGEPAAAAEALASYRMVSQQSIEDYGRNSVANPIRLKLFLDGITMAEGKSPTDNAGGV